MDNNEIDEVVQEFLLESYENLDRLDREFLELEQDPTSREVLASIFRTIHTIKGTAGFLGFDLLGELTHAGENLLSRLRNGELLLNQDRTNALLGLVDAVREMLALIEDSGSEGADAHPLVLAALTAAMEDESSAPPANTAAESFEQLVPETRMAEAMATVSSAGAPATAAPAVPATPVSSTPTADVAAPIDQPAAVTMSSSTSVDATVPDGSETAEPETSDVVAKKGEGQRSSALSDSTVRVDVSLLDDLMTLVGELVLARNRILQVASSDGDALLHNTAQQLNLVTAELQEGVMKTRLQPIQTIWGRFPRIVRDLALMCGKQVRIEMQGEDTELDRTIVEAIRDPMTHLIRNAVDHGIEPADVRLSNGKPAEGTISLSAYHEGSQVNIEMRDDGGGISLERVGAKAVAKGVITQEALDRMTDSQIVNLIFEPGLSTAESVSSVSGRGVGMDVVRSNIEKIGGSVEASSVPGEGTTMRMKIPLTLAIVPALIVAANEQPFAIPQVNVLELVRLEGEKAAKAIEAVGGARVYRLRGQLLPVLDMRALLQLDGGRFADNDDATAALADQALNIVVLKADNSTFGLVVDCIEQTQEIVVKPLGSHLKDISVYAGTTIMGDGKVALILDAVGLAKASSVAAGDAVARLRSEESETVDEAVAESLLVCNVGGQRVALRLQSINRLEVFPLDRIESSNGSEVAQYHGGRLLRLLRLDAFLSGSGHGGPAADNSALRVLVCEHENELIGLVVDDIVDIVSQGIVQHQSRNDGVVVASAVIAGHVTDVLDADLILSAASTPALSRW